MPEGFICPLCKTDHDSMFQLQNHFITQHSESSNDSSHTNKSSNPNHSSHQNSSPQSGGHGSPQNKNKKKNQDETSRRGENNKNLSGTSNNPKNLNLPQPSLKITNFKIHTTTGGIDHLQYKKQEIGDHDYGEYNNFFKKTRTSMITRAIANENKLLLRLEKLLKIIYLPKFQRRNYELSIVNWAADKDVPFCPDCSVKFSFLNFKFPHHWNYFYFWIGFMYY